MGKANIRRWAAAGLGAVLGLAAPIGVASACMWDYDTLAMERQQAPGTMELIAGQFVRHSDAFYEWRVDDRRARLLDHPDDLALIDDLAVALDKLDRHAEAIAVMTEALGVDPVRYETHANLGTFLVHAGDLTEGLRHIQRALMLNPNAHFGRERYQALLVRYVLERGADLPLGGSDPHYPQGFARFVLAHRPGADVDKELDRATQGVLGMMRFGNYRSPVVLEALGDLLQRDQRGAAYRMAAMAYVSAAKQVRGKSSEAYRTLATNALNLQVGVDLPIVEYDLSWEVADADARFAQIRADEAKWIADPDVDPDAAYAAKYFDEPLDARPQMAKEDEPSRPTGEDWTWLLWLPAGGAVLIVLAGRSHAMS